MSTGAVRVDWFPKDALEGMQLLDAWEELAYRRLIDLIYVSGGEVPDDAARLARFTKVGKRWQKVRQALLDMGKIEARDGCLTQPKCVEVLEAIELKREQASGAGKASAKKRKLLKSHKPSSTDVGTEQSTDQPTDGQPSHIASKPVSLDSSLRSESTANSARELAADAVRVGFTFLEAVGADPTPWKSGAANFGAVQAWLRAGYSPAEIVAVAKRRAETLSAARNPLAYATKLMDEEIRTFRAEQAAVEQADDLERSQWTMRLQAMQRGMWQSSWGPKPGQPGCLAPADLIAEILHPQAAE